MKKFLTCLLVMAFVASILTGCGGNGGKTDNSHPDKVVIGTMSTLMDQTLAIEKGYFEEAFGDEITVETDVFTNGRDCVQAMMAGDIDFFYSGCIAVVSGIANDMKGQVIWVSNALGVYEGVVVREGSGIDSLEDLRGKKVATPFVTTSHYILEYGLNKLAKSGTDISDIEKLDMKADEIYAAWTRGDIDAAAVWDPILSELEGGTIIYTGEDVANDSYPVTDICVVSDAFAEEYPDLVVKYIQALEKAEQLYKTDPTDVISTLAKALELTEEEAKAQLNGLTWLTGEDQMGEQYFGGQLAENLHSVAQYLYEGGNLIEELSIDAIEAALNATYIEQALGK